MPQAGNGELAIRLLHQCRLGTAGTELTEHQTQTHQRGPAVEPDFQVPQRGIRAGPLSNGHLSHAEHGVQPLPVTTQTAEVYRPANRSGQRCFNSGFKMMEVGHDLAAEAHIECGENQQRQGGDPDDGYQTVEQHPQHLHNPRLRGSRNVALEQDHIVLLLAVDQLNLELDGLANEGLEVRDVIRVLIQKPVDHAL